VKVFERAGVPISMEEARAPMGAHNLQVSPMEACVKIEVGLPLAEWRALPSAESASRRSRADDRMRMAGAHYVVDTIADVLPCFDDVAAGLARGEKP
jgi:hypothetical protein